jgi:nicotinate dehydrogenase subunit B
MDELAEAAGVDPVEFRLRHMKDARARDVIQAAADRFGWSKQPPAERGQGRGFAFARYKNLGAYCAIALDLAVEHETGRVQLGRVVAAVDSGQPSTPTGAETKSKAPSCNRQAGRFTSRFPSTAVTSRAWTGVVIPSFDFRRRLGAWTFMFLIVPDNPFSALARRDRVQRQPLSPTLCVRQRVSGCAICHSRRNE